MDFHSLGRKGQMNLGFMIAVVLLIAVIIFSVTQILGMVPPVKDKSDQAFLKASAYKISATLVDSSGYPKDWTSNPEVLGLAEYSSEAGKTEAGLLDPVKVSYANDSTKYSTFKSGLGLDRDIDFRILIENDTSTVLNLVNTSYGRTSNVVSIKRFAVLNNNPVNVTILVWY
ncbi:MAG: hypothetical protein R6U26_03885 [Candidatus Undinarchaeales archaeon]